MPPPTPAARVRRWNLHLRLWSLHRWLALGFGAAIVIISLSGSLLVIARDLERVLQRDRHVLPAPLPADAPRAEPADIVRRLGSDVPPGYRALRVEPATAPDLADKYIFTSDDGANRRWSATIHPGTGATLWSGPDQDLFRPWLLHLHEKFHAGNTGFIIAALSALPLTLLGLTGIYITRDRLRVLLRHPCRVHLGWRIALADLHKWLGLTGSYFTFVLGLTGLWFSWYIVPPILTGQNNQPLAAAFELDRLTPVLPALAATRAEFPDAEITRIVFPWDEGVRLQIRVLHRDAPIWAKSSRIDFDPVSGKQLRVRRAADAGLAAKFQSILGPLHFGHQGATWVKWAYVFGGLTPAALTLTGTALWWRRRRRSAPPTPPTTPRP